MIELNQSEANLGMKIVTLEDQRYNTAIKMEKCIATPLVIVFSSYPSVLGLHPEHLVGAEIAFRPNILKST